MPAQGRAGSEPPSGPNTDGVVALSPSYGENKEYITVCRSDIRKEMQCPICLGIIRKTRTVMECLHRFCRECIDKSMRLGNNECPACRTHCASRRSLRDDPNFDALVAAIYPDLDKYEEEELALFEDEARVNRQIQENIADTFKRQSEAIARRRTTAKATAAAIVRKAHGNFRSVQSRQRGRGRGRQGGRRSRYSEGSARYEDDDSYDNEKAETATSGDDTQSESVPERKRRRSKVQVSGYTTGEENSENESLSARTHDRHEVPATFGTEKMAIGSMERESDGDASPTNHEGTLKSWAKGTRSSRYGSVNGIPGTNGNSRSGRTLPRTKELIDALMAASHTENEFVVHLSLQPLNDESDEEDNISSLKRPHLCCPPSMTVHHLCKYLSTCLTTPPETELEILVESKSEQFSIPKPPPRLSKLSKGKSWASRADGGKEVMLLSSGHTLESVLCDFWDYNGNLELLYRRKSSILSN